MVPGALQSPASLRERSPFDLCVERYEPGGSIHSRLAALHFEHFVIVRNALEYGFARTKIGRQAPGYSGGDLLSSPPQWR